MKIKMPSVLSDADKETVKRTVPKPANKIHAVAVVRLYIAYPDRQRWTPTGLQGAAVLANDLVGNTYWIKLVDISVSLYPLPQSHVARRLTFCRGQTAASFGTRRFMSNSTTIRTEPFSIPLNWRIVSLACLSSARKKQNNSRRKLMIAKRTRVKRRRPILSRGQAASHRAQIIPPASPTAGSDSAACYTVVAASDIHPPLR